MAGRRSPVRYSVKRDMIYRSIEREHAREAEAIAERAKALLHDAQTAQAPDGAKEGRTAS